MLDNLFLDILSYNWSVNVCWDLNNNYFPHQMLLITVTCIYAQVFSYKTTDRQTGSERQCVSP